MKMNTIIRKRTFPKDMRSETTEISWMIKNFLAVAAVEDKFRKLKMLIKAGDSIGLPTKWKFFLKADNDKIGICCDLVESPKEVKEVWARFGFEFPGRVRAEDRAPVQLKTVHKGVLFPGAIKSLKDFPEANLTNGTLEIKIILTVYQKSFESHEAKRRKFRHQSHGAITNDLRKLLESGENADLTIEIEDTQQKLKVHTAVLTARSPVFARMLQTKMEERSTGVVRIEDVSYDAMQIVLKFIYSGEVDLKWENFPEETVYIADKYELLLLKKFCDENMTNACKPENAWNLLELAQRHGLKKAEIDIDVYIETHLQEIIKAKKSAVA